MLTIDFRGQPRARAIIVDNPVGKITGAVECMVCGAKYLVRGKGVEEISNSVEWFIKHHGCFPGVKEFVKEEFINAMVAEKFPECVVRMNEGNGHGLRRRE